MDYNPDIIFKDVAWTNDPFRIAQNPKVMSINSCLEIDLTGQICSDSIGTHMFSGVGGQVDFVYGSSRSEGGKSFLTMLSTTRKGMSKIKPVLTPGAVWSPRAIWPIISQQSMAAFASGVRISPSAPAC